MKATAQSLGATAPSERSWIPVLADLFKARLTSLVLLTTLVGFYMGQAGTMDLALMLHTLLGTALLASGASALNQFLERDRDALMTRTLSRPLPSGRMKPETVLVLGAALSVLGLVQLAIAVNLQAAAVGAVTLVSYLFVYTPLKTVTPLNTVVGAIPGALPPLLGWTAARGEITPAGGVLFLILFFWQLPHFLAIAWIYRDEYARAGFVMLPLVDPEGERTAHQAVGHALGLLAISLVPFVLGLVGHVYLAGAIVLGSAFLSLAGRFVGCRSHGRARALFLGSILYLPLLLGLMVLDKGGS